MEEIGLSSKLLLLANYHAGNKPNEFEQHTAKCTHKTNTSAVQTALFKMLVASKVQRLGKV